MKHAGAATLNALEPLLAQLRALPGIVERTPGCFYRGGAAFLHFHDDPGGVHADVRIAPPGFTRLRVESEEEGEALLARVAAALAAKRG